MTPSEFPNSETLSYEYATFGRVAGYNYNSGEATATYSFDPNTGRVSSLSGGLNSSTTSFNFAYAPGTDYMDSITQPSSGPYVQSRSLVAGYDVINNVNTAWSGSLLGNFTALYDTTSEKRGYRVGQQSGNINSVQGSWSKYLGLGDGISASLNYNGFSEAIDTPVLSWTGVSGTQNLANRNFSWSYDYAGNRLTEAQNGSTTNYSTTSTNPAANGALNEYTSISGAIETCNPVYDADGNLDSDSTWNYGYDAENRLISMVGISNGTSITFKYDYQGNRIFKSVSNGTTTTNTKYLNVNGAVVAEINGATNAVGKVFLYGADFSDAKGGAGGAGALLAQIDGTSGISYTIPDSYGNIVGYINSSGSIEAATEFSPNGRVIQQIGNTSNFPIGFSGHYTDVETGLTNFGARYYSGRHGRFINRDPIQEAGGNNLYAYVGNGYGNSWDIGGMDPGVGNDPNNIWKLAPAPSNVRSVVQQNIESGMAMLYQENYSWSQPGWYDDGTLYNTGSPEANLVMDGMGVASIPSHYMDSMGNRVDGYSTQGGMFVQGVANRDGKIGDGNVKIGAIRSYDESKDGRWGNESSSSGGANDLDPNSELGTTLDDILAISPQYASLGNSGVPGGSPVRNAAGLSSDRYPDQIARIIYRETSSLRPIPGQSTYDDLVAARNRMAEVLLNRDSNGLPIGTPPATAWDAPITGSALTAINTNFYPPAVRAWNTSVDAANNAYSNYLWTNNLNYFNLRPGAAVDNGFNKWAGSTPAEWSPAFNNGNSGPVRIYFYKGP